MDAEWGKRAESLKLKAERRVGGQKAESFKTTLYGINIARECLQNNCACGRMEGMAENAFEAKN